MPSLLMVTTVPVTHEAFLQPIVAALRSRDWRVDGMAAGITSSAACRAAYDGVIDVGWTRNPADLGHLPATLRAVRSAVAAGGYDIVHVHTPVAAFVTRFALRRMRRSGRPRVVYTAHGFHFAPGLGRLRNAAFRTLERIAGRWTDRLIVINADDRAAAARYRIVEPGRLVFMHGIGVDTDALRPEAVAPAETARVRAELGLAESDVLLLMVAEFTANKRHAAVIDAFARTTTPGLHLAFAGEGPELERARARALASGAGDRVRFLGYRTDVPALLAASAATVLFSAREGLPRSSMESLAMERPVIGADIRGLRDLLADGCGYLVPPGDVGALAAAMDRAATATDERLAMGRAGRATMAGAYSTRAIVDEHLALYASLTT